jgi:hypothetical protein
MSLRFLAILIAVVGLALPPPASAATAIYYSAPDQVYGWCAASGQAKAESCAARNCKKSGKQCELALECGGGWGAIAFAQDPSDAVGMSCDLNSAASARFAALASCMTTGKTMCWTYDTFDEDGDARPDKDNDAFDRNWFSQVALDILNIPRGKDGVLDGKTRDGLKEFQKRASLEANGTLDDTLFIALLDSIGGPVRIISSVRRGLNTDEWKGLTDAYYATGDKPAPEPNINTYWKGLKPERQKLALAVALSAKMKCTPPAASVTFEPDKTPDAETDAGTWTIVCSGATFTLQAVGDGSATAYNTVTPAN